MPSSSDQLRVLLAIGDLLARELLVREDDVELAVIRVDGRGYRYASRFWRLIGVLEPDGTQWKVRLDGGLAERARRRIAAEWICAGAPVPWARLEADVAVMLLLAHPDVAAPLAATG